MLAVVGDVVEDIVVWQDGALRYGTDNPSTIVRVRGGSAANVAAVAAERVATRFIGCVGDDDIGARLVKDLQGYGVDVRVQRHGRTGSIVVVVDSIGERTMFPDRGAAGELTTVDPEWLDDVTVLHLPSYCFASEPSAAAARELVQRAHARGVEVSIDTSSTALIVNIGRTAYLQLLRKLRPHLVFANAHEAKLLSPYLEALDAVLIVKDGAQPAVVRVPGQPPMLVPALNVGKVRDTTGAGDAFAAGFLAARLHGLQPRAAAVAGHGAARRVLLTPGAAVSRPPTLIAERIP